MGLPAGLRLRRGPEITTVLRRGRRVRAGGLVVHGLPRAGAPGAYGEPGAYGPRVGFIAPRTSGSAVARNRTRRRVQELLRTTVPAGAAGSGVDLVVRLLPEATGATAAELGGWLASALRRLGVTR